MNKHHIYSMLLPALSLVLGLTACNNSEDTVGGEASRAITFSVSHPSATTRATDTGFERDDRVGVFLTSSGLPLDVAGNYLTNVPLTFNGTTWSAPQTLYWNDGTYDAYAYYPYVSPVASVSDLDFSVATDQSTAEGYEASDFLWAKTAGVTASAGDVPLQFNHRMSRMMIRLVKGEDYEGDELPEDAEVYIHNTVTRGTIDLNAGFATRDTHAQGTTIRARSLGNHRYTAIVIPQRLDNRVPLVEVVMKGVSYLYESKFQFKPGIQHNVLLAISTNPDQVKIEVGGEIQNWSE